MDYDHIYKKTCAIRVVQVRPHFVKFAWLDTGQHTTAFLEPGSFPVDALVPGADYCVLSYKGDDGMWRWRWARRMHDEIVEEAT